MGLFQESIGLVSEQGLSLYIKGRHYYYELHLYGNMWHRSVAENALCKWENVLHSFFLTKSLSSKFHLPCLCFTVGTEKIQFVMVTFNLWTNKRFIIFTWGHLNIYLTFTGWRRTFTSWRRSFTCCRWTQTCVWRRTQLNTNTYTYLLFSKNVHHSRNKVLK